MPLNKRRGGLNRKNGGEIDGSIDAEAEMEHAGSAHSRRDE